ncbi:BadF/BadG/BcrA/BcrD ATPase family protein [Ramlibacter sp.]|uniref:BadF/BadG/BcrA/BcrD ATPase family protein n=1 Tax=Ramlibacter sp. TaxID=1917967 RepID=UPI003D10B679
MVEYIIGIDGGGTGTRAVVARNDGRVLGGGESGPSALGQGIPQAWRHIELAIRRAFDEAGLPVPDWRNCKLAAGLSGVSHPPWRDEFIAANPGFAALVAETDSFTMLLGAHRGRPGAIVAAGTGSIGEVLRADGSRCTVGGWGFPVGDEGSGAWLGLHAVRQAQAAMDGRLRPGPLARHVFSHCGRHRTALQSWCSHAGQFEFAQLARAVFEYEASDPFAAQLLDRAAACIEGIAWALDPPGDLPLALAGSIGLRLAPRLTPELRERLVEAAEPPTMGALRLARRIVRGSREDPEQAIDSKEPETTS